MFCKVIRFLIVSMCAIILDEMSGKNIDGENSNKQQYYLLEFI